MANIRIVLVSFFLLTMPFIASAVEFDLDASDPQAVAEDFIQLLKEKSYAKAAKHVIPRDRESFESDEFYDALNKLPPISGNPEISVQANGHDGSISIPSWGQGVGFDLIYEQDRWWVRR